MITGVCLCLNVGNDVHIISLKYRYQTALLTLCLICFQCNAIWQTGAHCSAGDPVPGEWSMAQILHLSHNMVVTWLCNKSWMENVVWMTGSVTRVEARCWRSQNVRPCEAQIQWSVREKEEAWSAWLHSWNYNMLMFGLSVNQHYHKYCTQLFQDINHITAHLHNFKPHNKETWCWQLYRHFAYWGTSFCRNMKSNFWPTKPKRRWSMSLSSARLFLEPCNFDGGTINKINIIYY